MGTSENTIRNIVIIGDGYVGKTSILKAIRDSEFKDQIPNVYDAFDYHITINGKKYCLKFIDTAGQEEYSMLRKLSYNEANIFLLCFAVDDEVSFENLETKWMLDLKEYERVPIILVGTKSDLRDTYTECLDRDFILRFQKKIRALHYVECSAKTLSGIDDLMQKTIKIMVPSKERSCTVQ